MVLSQKRQRMKYYWIESKNIKLRTHIFYEFKKLYNQYLFRNKQKMDTKSIEEMISGEERRFRHADFDQDEALNIVEFQVI